MSKVFTYFSYKMQGYELDNGSRSLVLECNVSLVGIHNWCRTDRRKDRHMDSISIVPRQGDKGQ